MQKDINTNSLHYKMQDCFDIVWNTGDEIERDWSVNLYEDIGAFFSPHFY